MKDQIAIVQQNIDFEMDNQGRIRKPAKYLKWASS